MRSRSPAKSAASSPPVPARTSSIAARSSAASRGQQPEREVALGLGELLLGPGELLDREGAQFIVAIVGHLFQRRRLVAQPPQLPGRGRDRLDLGIFLGEADQVVGRKAGSRHGLLQLIAPRLDRRDPLGGDAGHSRRCSKSDVTAFDAAIASAREHLSS